MEARSRAPVIPPDSASWSLPVTLPESGGASARAAEETRWFREEVQPYEARLRSYLRHRFPTIADVDDIVQETYARLLRERQAGKVFEPRSYLFPVARNVVIDIFRRSRTVAAAGGRCRRDCDRSGSRDPPLLLDRVLELDELEDRHLPERVENAFHISCHLSYSSSSF